ncbi:hypothetical protein [Polynucleobacter sp. MWH-UH23A]|uniref:hypothetical protein n=1 Tax=Polynucleobacter sp. MWH-UH23A TaxID=1855613 RepID=UPI0033651A08
MKRLCNALITPLFFVLITFRIADISIANLEIPRNSLNNIMPFMVFPIILINIQIVPIEYFKRAALFFLLPISVLIFSSDIRALGSIIALIFLIPLYRIFLSRLNPKNLTIILSAIIFIILYDLINSKYFGIYNWGYYGRDRLFLGIFHPKDQAYLIIYLYLLLNSILSNKRFVSTVFYFFSLICIYLTDSRGAMLGFVVFGGVSFFGNKVIKFLIPISLLAILAVCFNYNFEEINTLSSNRVGIWLDILNQNINPSNSIDSSFLYFSYHGIYGLFAIIFWIIFAFIIAFKSFGDELKYFILIITLGIFDLGLFSFSNLVALHCWTLCLLHEEN